MRKTYTDKASMAKPFIAALLKLVESDKQNEALNLLANIFLKGNQANPRPANGTMKVRALEAAFAEYKQVHFGTKPITGYNGKSFNVVTINVDGYQPTLTDESESDDE